jgi:hypothetical protein
MLVVRSLQPHPNLLDYLTSMPHLTALYVPAAITCNDTWRLLNERNILYVSTLDKASILLNYLVQRDLHLEWRDATVPSTKITCLNRGK